MFKKIKAAMKRKKTLKILRENMYLWHQLNTVIIEMRADEEVTEYLSYEIDPFAPASEFEGYLVNLLGRIFEVTHEEANCVIFHTQVPKLLMPHADILNINNYEFKRKLSYKNRSL